MIAFELGDVQKAKSVRSFAARLNLTNIIPIVRPCGSTLFRFVHVDGSTSTSTSSFNKEGIRRTSDKCKIKALFH